jgi:hypothetical protein
MKLEEIKKKIKEKSSREARSKGTPYSDSDIDRELASAGWERKPEDIPTQDTVNREGKIKPGNVTGFFKPSTFYTGGVYKLGPAQRPVINHDAGFSRFPKQEPTLSDYWALFKWRSMSDGAGMLRSDLVDAVAAYNHFHDGEGKPKTFSYDRYIMNDNSGRITLRNAILEAQYVAIELYKKHAKSTFEFTGPMIPCGTSDKKLTAVQSMYPYPATENWQKTIGAHAIWLSGRVKVTKPTGTAADPKFKMDFTLHAEDQYNFNPGMKDIATGLPDSDNGRFVVVGFAQGFRHNAQLKRSFEWKGFKLGVASMGIRIHMRTAKPELAR